jgi:protein-disulfide isomerase
MKKQLAMVAICAALLMCVAAAGCTSSTSSSPNASAAANSSSQAATALATATPAASATPTPTVTPAASATPTPTVTPAASATPTPTATSPPSGGLTSLTVLFFYDPNCTHCQAIEPQVPTTSTDGGRVSWQWIDSVTSPLTDQYGVTTVPTFVFLSGGSQVGSPVVAPTSTAPVNAEISSLLS